MTFHVVVKQNIATIKQRKLNNGINSNAIKHACKI